MAVAAACVACGAAGFSLGAASGGPPAAAEQSDGPVSAVRLRMVAADVEKQVEAQIGAADVRAVRCSARTPTAGACAVRFADGAVSWVDVTYHPDGTYRWRAR